MSDQPEVPENPENIPAFKDFDFDTGAVTTEGPMVRITPRSVQLPWLPPDPQTGGPRYGELGPPSVLVIGAGPQPTELGLPTDPSNQAPGQADMTKVDPNLIDLTQSDLQPRDSTVIKLDATQDIPQEMHGQFDTVIVTNPREYQPDIANIGSALRPGGQIIIQGRARVTPDMPGTVNPDMDGILNNLADWDEDSQSWKPDRANQDPNRVPAGFRVAEVKTDSDTEPGTPSAENRTSVAWGGPGWRTDNRRPVAWPNTRIAIQRLPTNPAIPTLECSCCPSGSYLDNPDAPDTCETCGHPNSWHASTDPADPSGDAQPYDTTSTDTPDDAQPYDTTSTDTSGDAQPYDTTSTDTPDDAQPYDTTTTDTPDDAQPYDTTSTDTPDDAQPYDTTTTDTPDDAQPYDTTTTDTPDDAQPYDTTSTDTSDDAQPYDTTSTDTSDGGEQAFDETAGAGDDEE